MNFLKWIWNILWAFWQSLTPNQKQKVLVAVATFINQKAQAYLQAVSQTQSIPAPPQPSSGLQRHDCGSSHAE